MIVVRGIVLLLVAAFTSSSANASADELTAVPNRPTASTTAESVKAGVFEIEAGVEAAADHQNLNGLAKLGLRGSLERWVGADPIERDRDADRSGFGDTAIGAKWRFVSEHADTPSFALLYLAKLPTAREGLGSGE